MMESHIRVPTLQGNKFSDNDRWAECVRQAASEFTDSFREEHKRAPDPIWAVLISLPTALERFNTLSPEERSDG